MLFTIQNGLVALLLSLRLYFLGGNIPGVAALTLACLQQAACILCWHATPQDANSKVWLAHNQDFWAGVYLLSNVTVIANFTKSGTTHYRLITWVGFIFHAHWSDGASLLCPAEQ